jgi:hypothetical protein
MPPGKHRTRARGLGSRSWMCSPGAGWFC